MVLNIGHYIPCRLFVSGSTKGRSSFSLYNWGRIETEGAVATGHIGRFASEFYITHLTCFFWEHFSHFPSVFWCHSRGALVLCHLRVQNRSSLVYAPRPPQGKSSSRLALLWCRSTQPHLSKFHVLL